MFLHILIALKTGMLKERTECIVSNNSTNEVFNFFWILEKSCAIAEYQVRDGDVVLMPKDFGWKFHKWVEEITYISDCVSI